MNIPQNFLNKKILILGLGVEGCSTLSYFHTHHPSVSLYVTDKTPLNGLSPEVQQTLKSTNATYFGGDTYLTHLKDFEVLFRSPGISPYLPEIVSFAKSGGSITSQTQIFLHNYRHITIGITGTKGKSTTSSLLYHVLHQGGFDAQLIGNIGLPPFSYAGDIGDKTIFVYEFSSHQLQDVANSPHVAVILDVVPEHLDYYPSFSQYREAKTPIVRYQTTNDIVVFNQELPEPRSFAALSRGKKYPFSFHPANNSFCFVDNDHLWYQNGHEKEKIIAIKDVPLKGFFNLNNVMPAIVVGKYFNISVLQIHDALATFTPLPSRLENIGTFSGITFYDDSLATIAQATIGALDALGSDVQTIIVGGFERNQNFDTLAQKILAGEVKTVIVFPTTGRRIWESIEKHNSSGKKLQCFPVDSMEKAVSVAFAHTQQGKICLLSSASPSFSLFKNYKEKSKAFRYFVKKQSSSN